ncbi:MAG: hypothetical protein HUU20_03640 [Pirellulales bacterium]|nr:hypothetical protein [Pirellulales bacterium]
MRTRLLASFWISQGFTPPRADEVGIAAGEMGIIEEFGLEAFQVGVGLGFGVGDDPDVRFVTFEGGAERIGERGEGGFCAAAGAEDVELGWAVGEDAIEFVGHPLVHGGRGLGELLGEMFLGPGEKRGGAESMERGVPSTERYGDDWVVALGLQWG